MTRRTPAHEKARRALARRAAQSPLPQLPVSEAQPFLTRAAKSRDRDLFGGHPVRQLVDEHGHPVLLHNKPVAQGQFGRVYVGLAIDKGTVPQLRMFKKLRLVPAAGRHAVEPTSLHDLALEIATARSAQSALAPQRVMVTRSCKARAKAYLEMPVMGGTLRHLLANASQEDRLLLARAMLADGLAQLAQAHASGVVHRDIKPDNLFFHDGGIVLGDWGLACFAHDRLSLAQSAGTPNFAAPEVLDRRVGERGPAMDLWSLGITVLQAVLGEEEPWCQARLSAYNDARDQGESREQATDAALSGVKQAHEDYCAWHPQSDASARDLSPELARFAIAYGRLDGALRTLLLRLMAPHPTERGSAAEHLASLQGTPLALGPGDASALQALYAAQKGTSDDVAARRRVLRRSAESLRAP